jgi:hypothetical protein
VPAATATSVPTVVPPGPIIGDIEFDNPNPDAGDNVVVTIPITNPGATPIEVDVNVEVDGVVVQRTVTIPAGGTIEVNVSIVAPEDPKDVVITVGTQTATAKLTPTPPRGVGRIIGIIVGFMATMAMVAIVMVVYLRRRTVVPA